ncbi:FAM184A [Symbiodinium sp. KB8]|nr:FAM184A [Symbiodinium sp. KB8]
MKQAFASRPSREDDLVRISKLTKLVQLKDAEVGRLKEEMKFFKLELVNRETNFNKVFARQPNVGVMNPLGARAGGATGGAGGSGASTPTARTSKRGAAPAPPGGKGTSKLPHVSTMAAPPSLGGSGMGVSGASTSTPLARRGGGARGR